MISSDDIAGKDLFDSWAGFSLICPDVSEESDFFLHGNQASMVSENFEFIIAKCD
jgi:hypothetical protein